MLPIRKLNGQNWFPDLFNDFFVSDWMVKVNTSAPAVNVVESDDDYKVEVAVPGLNKDDFSINLTDRNEMVITMEKKNEVKEDGKKNKKFLRREFSYAKFQQSMLLPNDVDKERIAASVVDGVLIIDLPKHTPEQNEKINRVIEIK
ncbi:MAG: Hsp20/alpha crystallin family protein [Paraprevotella sp.]|jgi:HSP20 family protein|nr:Hsp20/alpha crystallin family protein [Paraprevotella sp.]